MSLELYGVSLKEKKTYLDKLKSIDPDIEYLNQSEGIHPRLKGEFTDKKSYNTYLAKLKDLKVYVFHEEYNVNSCIGDIEFILDSNMLILGNGFDLASGLKTRYKDFLKNIDIINKILSGEEAQNDYSKEKDIFIRYFKVLFGTLDEDLDNSYGIIDFYKSLESRNVPENLKKFQELHFDNKKNDYLFKIATQILGYMMRHDNSKIINNDSKSYMACLIDEFPIKWLLAKLYIEENTMIQYFLKIYNKMQDNWIDIEAEIYKIINCVENIIKNVNENQDYVLNLEDKIANEELYSLIFFNSIKEKEKIIYENIKKDIQKGENELDQFDFLLENYLDTINKVNEKDICYIDDIYDIHSNITHLLSFNYTDVFRKKYFKIDDEHTDFIHGKIGKNNLVLGTNETLDSSDESKMLDCIYFKKYFQRVYNKTGAQYSKWLDEVSFKTVYIFGHSLDVTDKEILKEVIEHKNIGKVVIYYHNEDHHRQEIVNLIKILDKNKFLQYAAKEKIEFKKQSE